MTVQVEFQAFRPLSLLDIVDAIWDWDVADGQIAKTLTIRHPPRASLFLVAQYRVPVRMDWQFGPRNCFVRDEYQLFATHNQTGVINIHPRGPLGVIVVSLKPEGAARIIGAPMQVFANTKIELRNLFNASEVSLLEEKLTEAKNGRERIKTIEAFLLQQAGGAPQKSVACQAALLLRDNPALPVHRLASELDVSAKKLLRRFQATFGTTPKRFARLARVDKVFAARRNGEAWGDIAYSCGFADQAHMIRGFKDVIGQTPGDFFSISGRRVHCGLP